MTGYLGSLLIILAGASAIFAAFADAALLAIDPDDAAAQPRLAQVMLRRERCHRALNFLRLVSWVVAGSATSVLLGLATRRPEIALVLAVLGAALLAAAAEGAARAMGDALGTRVALRLAPATRLVESVFTPVVRLGEWIDARLLALMPPPSPTEEAREASTEQFREVVAAEAEVAGGQEALLHRVFNLSETEVHDVMVPRIDILGVDFDDPWSEVLDRVRSSGHARLPVYRETLDEIVGILYAKDLLPAVIEDEPPQEGWHKLIRPALFIPPTKPVDDQLREFRASGTHIAIVVDEYGGTAGLVTIEDVLEELVGEIQDEYDEELPLFEKEDGTKWWVSARLSLDELSEMIGHDFHREGVNTVGGLIYDLLGRVPRSGEELVIDNFRVVVERVVKRRIQRVYFEGHDPTDSEEDQAHAEREA